MNNRAMNHENSFVIYQKTRGTYFMSTVFRIATTQAIREIVEENAVSGRFGLIVTEENIEEIAKRVVDLFEMTLDLRAKTQDIFGGALGGQASSQEQRRENAKPAKRAFSRSNKLDISEEGPFPKSRNSSEIYDFKTNNNNTQSRDTSYIPSLDAKLPRKRFELSPEEKERFMRR